MRSVKKQIIFPTIPSNKVKIKITKTLIIFDTKLKKLVWILVAAKFMKWIKNIIRI